jgi:hypothetical protein
MQFPPRCSSSSSPARISTLQSHPQRDRGNCGLFCVGCELLCCRIEVMWLRLLERLPSSDAADRRYRLDLHSVRDAENCRAQAKMRALPEQWCGIGIGHYGSRVRLPAQKSRSISVLTALRDPAALVLVFQSVRASRSAVRHLRPFGWRIAGRRRTVGAVVGDLEAARRSGQRGSRDCPLPGSGCSSASPAALPGVLASRPAPSARRPGLAVLTSLNSSGR